MSFGACTVDGNDDFFCPTAMKDANESFNHRHSAERNQRFRLSDSFCGETTAFACGNDGKFHVEVWNYLLWGGLNLRAMS